VIIIKKISFSQLINVNSLKKMAENIYDAAGIPIGIVDTDGIINVAVGWQDICTKFHRAHPDTCKRCSISDQYVKAHIKDSGYISYKCLNNMWDIGVPIIVAGEHIATIFFGQFFYENEVVDIEYFRSQALEYGFDEKEYLDALRRVPTFTKKKVEHIIQYYLGLVMTLVESGLSQLQQEEYKEELEKSQKYLNTIFNSVNDVIFIHDVFGNIIDVNEAAISMFGYSRNEITSMNINEIILYNSDQTEFNIETLVKKARNKNPLLLEFIVKNKDNSEFWVEVNIHITNIDEDEKIIATVRDITERKQAELVLKNEAIELEKLRTEFFANISHELRTPLNVIMSTLQLLESQRRNSDTKAVLDKQVKHFNIMKQNCYRQLRLVNNLIDSTKIDSGLFEINQQNHNIVSIVEDITLSVSDYIANKGIELVFDTNVEEKIMACDLDCIERIILNLLSNAVKFTKEGGSIFVNINDKGETILISVKDSGIGIPKDKYNTIFDRFRQVEKSLTRNYEGSGIGLSLVKSLVEMHKGKISVQSEYGNGAEFIIELPIRTIPEVDTVIKGESTRSNVEKIHIEFEDIYNFK